MADEYILRSIAIAKLTALEVTDPFATIVDAKRVLADMAAADVATVVHGHWIKDKFFSDEVNNGEKCSQCGELIGWFGNLPKYCPGCGALMDGGNKDG